MLKDYFQNSQQRKTMLITSSEQYIPVIFIPAKYFTNKIILYFHANAEDIGITYSLVKQFTDQLKVNAVIVEYPGYGIYKGKPNVKQIFEDTLIIFDYLVNDVGF